MDKFRQEPHEFCNSNNNKNIKILKSCSQILLNASSVVVHENVISTGVKCGQQQQKQCEYKHWRCAESAEEYARITNFRLYKYLRQSARDKTRHRKI